MTASTHSRSDFTYTGDGALVVSDERVDAFIAEWKDELDWLAER